MACLNSMKNVHQSVCVANAWCANFSNSSIARSSQNPSRASQKLSAKCQECEAAKDAADQLFEQTLDLKLELDASRSNGINQQDISTRLIERLRHESCDLKREAAASKETKVSLESELGNVKSLRESMKARIEDLEVENASLCTIARHGHVNSSMSLRDNPPRSTELHAQKDNLLATSCDKIAEVMSLLSTFLLVELFRKAFLNTKRDFAMSVDADVVGSSL